jgi:hypothetical protein
VKAVETGCFFQLSFQLHEDLLAAHGRFCDQFIQWFIQVAGSSFKRWHPLRTTRKGGCLEMEFWFAHLSKKTATQVTNNAEDEHCVWRSEKLSHNIATTYTSKGNGNMKLAMLLQLFFLILSIVTKTPLLIN